MHDILNFITNTIYTTLSIPIILYDIYRSERDGRKLINIINDTLPSDAFTPDKYTIKELKDVIPINTPYQEWTLEQEKELDNKFKIRQSAYYKYCREMSPAFEEHKRKLLEENNCGVFVQLMALGPADDTHNNSPKDAMSTHPNYYRSFKHLYEIDDTIDDEYKKWFYDEYNKKHNKELLNFISCVNSN